MTAPEVTRNTASGFGASSSEGRAFLPVMLILLLQVGIYVWLSPRAFDFTDESFYLLNLLYWRDLTATVTLFGACFELLFRMLDESVTAIRIVSLSLLLTCGGGFTYEALRFAGKRDGNPSVPATPFVLVGMAAALLHFGVLTTLRVPSYNLLALCSALTATAVLLRILDPAGRTATPPWLLIVYGLALGTCVLGKVSTGALTVACHAIFFACMNRGWGWRRTARIAGLTLVGAAMCLAAVHLAHPDWLSALREGVVMVGLTDHRSVLGLANALRWDIQTIVALVLPWTLGGVIALGLLTRLHDRCRRSLDAAAVLVITAGCLVTLVSRDWRYLWWLVLGIAVLFLWCVEALARKPFRFGRNDARELALTGLLFSLPIVVSFGTNMRVVEHSQHAGVFAIVALLIRLRGVYVGGVISRRVLAIALTSLCIPSLTFQIEAATDPEHTYRQSTALGAQTVPVRLGAAGHVLLVDEPTRQTIEAIASAARSGGFEPGQAIVDFTGDGPGLIYALGGRPLGVAWLLGGYPGSGAAAAHLIDRMPIESLRHAWLLSSATNPRAIGDWQSRVDARVGADAFERVAVIRVPAHYRWRADSPDTVDVQLWRPRNAAPRAVMQR